MKKLIPAIAMVALPLAKIRPASTRVFQLDWRLGLLMDLQLASQTPVIEP
jgi:hypothetical protein